MRGWNTTSPSDRITTGHRCASVLDRVERAGIEPIGERIVDQQVRHREQVRVVHDSRPDSAAARRGSRRSRARGAAPRRSPSSGRARRAELVARGARADRPGHRSLSSRVLSTSSRKTRSCHRSVPPSPWPGRATAVTADQLRPPRAGPRCPARRRRAASRRRARGRRPATAASTMSSRGEQLAVAVHRVAEQPLVGRRSPAACSASISSTSSPTMRSPGCLDPQRPCAIATSGLRRNRIWSDSPGTSLAEDLARRPLQVDHDLGRGDRQTTCRRGCRTARRPSARCRCTAAPRRTSRRCESGATPATSR